MTAPQLAAFAVLALFSLGTCVAVIAIGDCGRTRDRLDDQARAAAIARATWAEYFRADDPLTLTRLGGDMAPTPMFPVLARLWAEAEETAAREAGNVVAEAEKYAREAAR